MSFPVAFTLVAFSFFLKQRNSTRHSPLFILCKGHFLYTKSLPNFQVKTGPLRASDEYSC
jgi:hypothetical protein